MAYKLRQRQKLSTLQRGTLIIGGISVVAVAAYFSVIMNTADVEISRANELLISESGGSGETILSFSWDGSSVLVSDKGPHARNVSPNAECAPGAVNNTAGLSAGNSNKDINLTIGPDPSLNTEGIDISLDFRRMEDEGNFYSRGKDFSFGIKEGKVHIRYKLTTPQGKSYLVEETTGYEVPHNDGFRNIRFIYDPQSGKGEILVEKATVWSNQAAPGCRLTWKEQQPVLIAEGLNGEGSSAPIMDNLVVRSTSNSGIAPIQLLSFTAELQNGHVMLNWFTARENGTDYYVIEKSQDTKIYREIGRVKGSGESSELKAYALYDKEPAEGVTYYRLALNNSSTHSVWVPVIAIRVKPGQLPAQAAVQPPINSGSK
jgi:hypothetical protein